MKLKSLVLVSIFVLYAQLFGIDTTEVFEPGLSDIEYAVSWNSLSKLFGNEFLIGYGFKNSVCIGLSCAADDSDTHSAGVSVIYTCIDNVFSLDIISGYTKKLAVSDGKYALGSEAAYRIHNHYTPYTRITAAADTTLKSYSGTIDLGFSAILNDKTESLLEYTLESTGNKNKLASSIAVGLNIVLTDTIEMVDEIRYFSSPDNTINPISITIGIIATV